MKTITFILFLGLFTSISFGQATILSQRNIGGSGDDGLMMYNAPNNNGYYLIGTSNSNISFDKSENSRGFDDLWIVRTDSHFNVLWDKTIGGFQDDRFADCIVSDTAIYCVITTFSSPSGEITEASHGQSDILLLKMDLNGSLVSQKRFGGTGYDSPNSLRVWGSKLLLIGTSDSPISGNKTVAPIGGPDWWLLELELSDFSITTQKVIGSNTGDKYLSSVVLNNELFVMGASIVGTSGDKTDVGYGSTDVWIIKLDATLNPISDKCFGGSFSEDPSGFITTDGDNLYFANASYSGVTGNKTSPNRGTFDGNSRTDFWVVKLDSDLNKIWENTFGGTHNDNPTGIYLYDDIVIVGGSSRSAQNSGNKVVPSYGNTDGFIVVLDSSGVELGQFAFGGTGSEGASIFHKSGDTLFFAASSNSPVSGNKTVGSNGGDDAWIMKLKLSYLSTPTYSMHTNKIHVYPNPFREQAVFEFPPSEEERELLITSTEGRLLQRISIPAGETQINWQPTCESGVYLYSIDGNSGRIVVEK